MRKNLLWLSFLPLLGKGAYLISAWRHSPLDRWDWLFFVLFAGVFGIGIRTYWRQPASWHPMFALVIAFAALLGGYGMFKPVHALAILGWMILPWGALGLCGGWRAAHALLPAFGILLLGCPGSSYWLHYFFGVDGLPVKMAVGGGLLWWQLRIWRGGGRLSLETLFFAGGMLLVVLLYCWTPENYVAYAAWQPDLANSRSPIFIGREEYPNESDRYIAGDSAVRRFFFAGPENQSLEVLTVGSIRNIHRIHPVSHCLRTSGNRIVAEELRETGSGLHPGRQVGEIIAENAAGKTLFWVWYSSPTISTGNFLFFRYAYSPREDWRVFQLATPLTGEPEKARELLRRFLNDMVPAVASPTEY